MELTAQAKSSHCSSASCCLGPGFIPVGSILKLQAGPDKKEQGSGSDGRFDDE
jgi:hypothetical protein